MADNLGDYNNFFSGDYWNSRATEQRRKDSKASAQKRSQERSNARTGEWNAIGTGLGVAGAITNFFNGLPANKRKEEQKKAAVANKPRTMEKHFNWEPGKLALRPNAPVPATQHPFSPNGTRQGADDIPESDYRDGRTQSPLEILMEQLNQGYEGPDPSKMDFSALDRALNSRLGQIGDARNKVQGNFDKSDANLKGMHSAFENDIRTRDAGIYNKIADDSKANFTQNMNTSVGSMEGARAKAVAERTAMLKNLGQEAIAGEADPTNAVWNEGINTAQLRNNTNMNMAEQGRATNLAYNNTVAQSVGQQGVQRRSALEGQLQGLLGKLAMAESEAKSENEIERQRAMSSAGNAGYDQWNDQQNRRMDMFKILSGEELAREKMSMQPGPKATGMGGMAESLGAILPPEEASAGIAALNSVLGEGNYLQGANGTDGNDPYDKRAILIQKLRGKVPEHIATAVGMAYSDY